MILLELLLDLLYEVLPNLKTLSYKRFDTLVKRIQIIGDMIGKVFWFVPIYFMSKMVTWIIVLFSSLNSGLGMM